MDYLKSKYKKINDILSVDNVAMIYSDSDENKIYIQECCDYYFKHELTKDDCINLSNLFKDIYELM